MRIAINPLTNLLCLSCLLLMAPPGFAQGFSYDGNRWYEIEVSIFSNEASSTNSELVIPEKTDLSYPELIRQLVPASKSFEVPFENTDTTTAISPPGLTIQAPFLLEREQEQPLPEVMIGAASKPGENSFRIMDFSRDPFIALGGAAAEFLDYNRDLDQSPQHRLLFHAIWRQPVLNRVQSTAIFVAGGQQYGIHHELEGSLRFSFNVNRVDVEARLWLMDFASVGQASETRWQIPEPPFASENFNDPPYQVVDLAYLNQVRSMISNELHYLDHPDFGLLVQIRPYQLPQPVSFSFE